MPNERRYWSSRNKRDVGQEEVEEEEEDGTSPDFQVLDEEEEELEKELEEVSSFSDKASNCLLKILPFSSPAEFVV